MPDTRTRILTATGELFRRHGFHGTSLKQVTQAAAATTGSLYHFFPGGKDELARAVLTTSGAAYQELFELIADGAATPADAISDFFDGAADTLEEHDFVDICPIGTVAREVASTDETLRAASQAVFGGWIDAAARRFAAAGLPAADANELATTVVAALDGAIVLARTARDAGVLRVTGRNMRALVDARMRAPVRNTGANRASSAAHRSRATS